MVVKEFLDSDRVNFLVWRYLLEGNYRETAAKFQKEWHVREPHRDFPFARHVHGRALVSVINRGLLYYALEREYALTQLPQGRSKDRAQAEHWGVFGPLNGAPPPMKQEASDPAQHDYQQPQKPEQAQQQPPPQSPTPPSRQEQLAASAPASAPAAVVAAPAATALSPLLTTAAAAGSLSFARLLSTTPAQPPIQTPAQPQPQPQQQPQARLSSQTDVQSPPQAPSPPPPQPAKVALDPIRENEDSAAATTTKAAEQSWLSPSMSKRPRLSNVVDTTAHPAAPNATALPQAQETISPKNTTIPMDVDHVQYCRLLHPLPTTANAELSQSESNLRQQTAADHPGRRDDTPQQSNHVEDGGRDNYFLDNHAYPSPCEVQSPQPPPAPQTAGPQRGTQIEKVEELLPVTTFIRLIDDDDAVASATTPSASPMRVDAAPVLLQCEWNPRKPSVLAAGGTDALARVWTVPRFAPTSDAAPLTSPSTPDHALSAHTLLEPDTPRSTTVTALSWTSDGTAVAVATDSATQAFVSVWSADGIHMQTMNVSEPPVIKLSWNSSNAALLAIYPHRRGAAVTIFTSPADPPLTHHLPAHDITATPLDAAWTSDTDFLLCGGNLLASMRCADATIARIRLFDAHQDDSFTQLAFDWRCRLAATASDKGTLDLWDESGQRRSILAHQGAITTMSWQPLPTNAPQSSPQLPSTPPDDERLIATGGDDCAILLWNARKPDSKAKCFLTMEMPIVRLAFSPDGAFIAGATSRQVLIWKVGSYAAPRASWKRPPHAGWLSPKGVLSDGGGGGDDEDEHCLSWDASGQKLAFGSNSKLAVINFSR